MLPIYLSIHNWIMECCTSMISVIGYIFTVIRCQHCKQQMLQSTKCSIRIYLICVCKLCLTAKLNSSPFAKIIVGSSYGKPFWNVVHESIHLHNLLITKYHHMSHWVSTLNNINYLTTDQHIWRKCFDRDRVTTKCNKYRSVC